MSVNTAHQGRQREWMIRDYLAGTDPESKTPRRFPGFGWTFVSRAAASKGPADLTFVKPGVLLLVQVKLTDPQLSPAERRQLIATADVMGLHLAVPLSACWPLRAPKPTFRMLTGPGPKDWVSWDPADFSRTRVRAGITRVDHLGGMAMQTITGSWDSVGVGTTGMDRLDPTPVQAESLATLS